MNKLIPGELYKLHYNENYPIIIILFLSEKYNDKYSHPIIKVLYKGKIEEITHPHYYAKIMNKEVCCERIISLSVDIL